MALAEASEPGPQPGHNQRLLTLGVEGAPRWTRTDWLWASGLVVIALAVRLPGLDESLWYDEILTLLHYARLPAADIFLAAGSLNNHVLYTLAAHFSMAWFGESAWTMRLPALVFGVASVPALYHLGRQVASRPEAVLATTFLALNYHHVWFSQNARGYTGLLLAAVISTSVFIRLLSERRPGWRLLAGYAVIAALATGLHLTAAVVLVAHGLVWAGLALGALRRGQFPAAVPGGIALALAGGLALLINALSLPKMLSRALPSVVETDGGISMSLETARIAYSFSWGGSELFHGLAQGMPGGWFFVMAAGLALVAGAVSYVRQRPAVLALLLLPAVVNLTVVAVSGMLLFPRFLFSSTGFLILLGVRGGFSIGHVAMPFLRTRHVLIAGLAVALAGATKLPSAWQPKQPFDRAAQFLAAKRAPGDGVACLGLLLGAAFVEYLDTDCDPVTTPEELQEIERKHRRVWVVYTLPAFTARRYSSLWRYLESSGEYVLARTFDGTLRGGDVTVVRRESRLLED